MNYALIEEDAPELWGWEGDYGPLSTDEDDEPWPDNASIHRSPEPDPFGYGDEEMP